VGGCSAARGRAGTTGRTGPGGTAVPGTGGAGGFGPGASGHRVAAGRPGPAGGRAEAGARGQDRHGGRSPVMVPPRLGRAAVAYHVEFTDLVRDYLQRVEGLTDDDRATIVDGVIEELSRDADRFLALYPLAHESHCFRYDFRFVADASHLEMGVVRVAYVEHSTEPRP